MPDMPADPTKVAGATTPLRLRDEFPAVSTQAWDELARQDLKGQDYETRLVWRTDEGIAVKPFYRRDDVEGNAVRTGAVPGVPTFVRDNASPWQATETAAWPADAIRVDRLHDAGATATQELAWGLAEGVDRLAAAVAEGQAVAAAANACEFVVAVGSTYFIEIAKLRAVRLLWATAIQAFDADAAGIAPMRLHVRTARGNKSRYAPYTNLLRVTTEAMSAVIGGADTLLVEAHGFEPHLAINVQRILAEESHLGAVADPAAGCYYVEALTDALAREAWSLFQQIEAAGGHADAVRAGLLHAQLQASRAQRVAAVSSRRRTLVGVNDYPDLTEQAPAAGPFPGLDDDGLPMLRLAAPFEALRARTATHAEAKGRVPVVHLLTRGDLQMRMARATFCQNFFGCAGLAITEGHDLPAVVDLVVLCSGDTEYPALARAIVPTVSAPVIVAGHPEGLVEELAAIGVQGFVHVRSDAVHTLNEWQDRLGMVP